MPLGKLGGDAAELALKTVLQRESDTFVRGQAEKALAAAPAQPPQIKTGIQKTIDQIKAEMEKK